MPLLSLIFPPEPPRAALSLPVYSQAGGGEGHGPRGIAQSLPRGAPGTRAGAWLFFPGRAFRSLVSLES